MNDYDDLMHANLGIAEDLTLAELVDMVCTVVYPDAAVVFDSTRPDGTMRKRLDVSRLQQLGWKHRIDLREGIETTSQWFLAHHDEASGSARVPVASTASLPS